MLFVSSPIPARACIHCRFRAVQLSLQARRWRSGSNSSSRVRKIGGDSRLQKPGTKVGTLSFSQPPQGQLYRSEVSFESILTKRLNALKDDLRKAPVLVLLNKEQEQERGLFKDEDDAKSPRSLFERTWKSFLASITAEPRPVDKGVVGKHGTWFDDLQRTFHSGGIRSLDDRIKHAFYGHVVGARFTRAELERQKVLADLRYPGEWFPKTRMVRRKIHVHVGPTNSGKTYHALKRLEQARNGIYAGPLRLLAHEVYSRMNAKGRMCVLVTGEERRQPSVEEEDAENKGKLYSCTVEMLPSTVLFDVAVIDEIQMLGNAERGWAWTHALLGVQAREVHLCGEERTVPLIREICASIGEEVEIHRYERLTPLEMEGQSLGGSLRNLRKGDCLVSFSVMGIHALKRSIEKQTGKHVAIVYGSLPPETRAQQARLFNDPNNDYDFLVASDAIGMGLNLAIKRIVFESSYKFDGKSQRALPVADIKQIGGRAGRYRTSFQSEKRSGPQTDSPALKNGTPMDETAIVPTPPPDDSRNKGYVTTLENFDYPIVEAAMSNSPEPIRTAGIFPPASVVEQFANYFPPGTPFSYILTRLHELSRVNERYHLCVLRDRVWCADLIEPIRGLTTAERAVFILSPAGKTEIDLWKSLLPEFARCIAENEECHIPDIKQMPLEILEQEVSSSKEYLRDLERLHKGLVVYLWLSYRFAGVFSTRALAFHVKGMVEDKIEQVLDSLSFSETARRKVVSKREQKLLQEIQEALRASRQDDASDDATEQEDIDGLTLAQAKEWQAQQAQQAQQQRSEQSEEEYKVPGHEDDTRLIEPLEQDAISEQAEEAHESASSGQSGAETSGTSAPTTLDDLDAPISEAQEEGLRRAIVADGSGDIERVSKERPSVAELTPNGKSESDVEPELESLTDETMSRSSQDPESSTRQDGDADTPDRTRIGTSKPNDVDNKFTTSSVPLKHLVQAEGNATEVERKLESRP